MRVQFNGELLRTLIKRAGGIKVVQARWSLSSLDGDDDEARSNSTFYRWMRGQLPKNTETLMSLASTLDVDPFALLDVPEGELRAALDDLLELVQNRESVPAPLSFMKAFFGRQKKWPPEQFAIQYYGRSWEVKEIHHCPSTRRNFYQTIELKGDGAGLKEQPQVFHFAFHHPRSFGGRWLHYGSVFRHGRQTLLWHINGYTEKRELPRMDEPLVAETWFGQAPVTFRVASLHPFNLVVPAQSFGQQCPIRFPV